MPAKLGAVLLDQHAVPVPDVVLVHAERTEAETFELSFICHIIFQIDPKINSNKDILVSVNLKKYFKD